MFPYYSHDEILNDFILRFSECTLTLSEKKAFTEVMSFNPSIDYSARSGKAVTQLVKKLPRYRAKSDFDQRMAAAFALELEKDKKILNAQPSEEGETVG